MAKIIIKTPVFLTDPEYFCNKSWTLSYNMNTQSWVSFHSYIPNWYIAENNFFYSGKNECCTDFDFIVGVLIDDATTTTTTTARISHCELEIEGGIITSSTTTTIIPCQFAGFATIDTFPTTTSTTTESPTTTTTTTTEASTTTTSTTTEASTTTTTTTLLITTTTTTTEELTTTTTTTTETLTTTTTTTIEEPTTTTTTTTIAEEYQYVYNAYVALSGNVAPTGWHVPTQTDFTDLIDYLTANGYGYEGSGNDIAKSIAGASGWTSSDTAGTPGNDQSSNNSSGFNLSPHIFRQVSGNWAVTSNIAIIWTSTADTGTTTWDRWIFYNDPIVENSAGNNEGGLAIRFIKDNDTDPGTVTDFDGNIYNTVKINNQVWTTSHFKGVHYNNGDPITEVDDATAWAAATTEAYSKKLIIP